MGEFVRDQLFTIAWFGVMAMAWLGWAQESTEPKNRWKLGVGSVLGAGFAGVFGWLTVRGWDQASALVGRYHWFGLLTLVELVAAGVGAFWLARLKMSRWIAWWVAVVVALHFFPLALLLRDWTIAILGSVAMSLLGALVPRLRREKWPTSRLVGPVMGSLLLAYAAISAVEYAITG